MEKIVVTIKRCVGNKVKYEVIDGMKEKIDKPYRNKWVNAKFILPTGKKKCLTYPNTYSDQEVLSAVQKSHSNFKFTLATHA